MGSGASYVSQGQVAGVSARATQVRPGGRYLTSLKSAPSLPCCKTINLFFHLYICVVDPPTAPPGFTDPSYTIIRKNGTTERNCISVNAPINKPVLIHTNLTMYFSTTLRVTPAGKSAYVLTTVVVFMCIYVTCPLFLPLLTFPSIHFFILNSVLPLSD